MSYVQFEPQPLSPLLLRAFIGGAVVEVMGGVVGWPLMVVPPG
jgi:hypothetical protein